MSYSETYNTSSINDEQRYERKFAVSSMSIQEVMAVIKLHPALFREIYPPREVNNIYFDDAHLSAYTSNIEGLPNRTKVRLRWYGRQFGKIDSPILEMKSRRGLVGNKLRYSIIPLTISSKTIKKLPASLESQPDVPAAITEKLHHFFPVLLNRYRRRYFLSSDSSVRLTLDFQIQYYDILPNGTAPRNQLFDDLHLVVEIKYPTRTDFNISAITNFFPFRLSRNSKYVNGVARTLHIT